MKILMKIAVLAIMVSIVFFTSPGVINATENPAIKLEGKLNINTATAEKLTMLPGIGEKTSEQIISYRSNNGPFKEVSDLMNVKGVGKIKLESIKNFLDITGENTLKRTE